MCLGLFQPQTERVAIEALQICTLLLPPSSRRKLQLLMRMMCRISQNVDMPRLHPAIGTRTLVRPGEAQPLSSPIHDTKSALLNSHHKCPSVNIFRRCFHFLFASLSFLSLICYSPLQMVHTFSGCILGSAVECDLDELLATRLVSFLLDHQERILSVPEYLLSAINSHIQYLRTVQASVLHPGALGGVTDQGARF